MYIYTHTHTHTPQAAARARNTTGDVTTLTNAPPGVIQTLNSRP